MAKTVFATVAEYIAAQPADAQVVLERVRRTIRDAMPLADEVISYQIPTFKLPGGAVVYFAGWKEHWSLYPATERVLTALGDEIAPYEVRKGTIRFPLSGAVPVELIAHIAKLRADEVIEQAKAKAAKAKRR